MTQTPTPWNAEGNRIYFIDGEGYWGTIAETYQARNYVMEGNSADNAAFIVKAVNAHDELVEALTALEAALCKDSRNKSISRDTVEYHLDGQEMYQAINAARAVLAKVQSGNHISEADASANDMARR